jgi:hypothetical protein
MANHLAHFPCERCTRSFGGRCERVESLMALRGNEDAEQGFSEISGSKVERKAEHCVRAFLDHAYRGEA